jgi:uncharacterized protein
MADFQSVQARTGVADMSVDAGLRSFMLGVYNKLMLGIAVAGGLAFAAGTYDPLTQLIFGTPLLYVIMWGPLVLLLGSSFLMRNPSPLATGILYWSIVTMIGLSLGMYVLMADENISSATRGGIGISLSYVTIAKAFLITASCFGALSLFGYVTKRDLSGIGSFSVMALWGVVALSVLNLILPPSSLIEWIIMGAVFALSAVLVATGTQQLKHSYYALGGDARSKAVLTNYGALNFFISFVNMFRIVLMLLGSRR